MTRFVVAATPLAGHTQPLLRIAAGLTRLGHTVDFLGGSRYLEAARSAGAEPHALPGAADYDDRRLSETFPERLTLAPGPEQLNYDIARIFGDAIPDGHAGLQARLDADPDRVLISDSLFLGAWPGALGVGLAARRWIAVGIAPVYAASVDTTPMGPLPGLDPDDADAVEAAHRAANAAIAASFAPGFDHVTAVCARLGAELREPDYLSAIYALPDLTAQLTVAEFEFPRRDLPSQIHYVGALAPLTTDWDTPAWWADLEHRAPVVLVTQGTLANDDLGELVAPTLQALGDGPGLTVAALGREREGLVGPVPENARVEPFIPFETILDRVDVFVTNGGYGATQAALAHGVPVVVAGVSEDKPAIAARVAHHRVGIDLATATPTPDQIAQAVQAILADTGYRARAGALAQAYAGQDPVTQIAELGLEPAEARLGPR